MDSASRQAVLIGNTGFLGRAIELQLRSSQNPYDSLIVPDHRALVAALLHPSGGGEVLKPLLNSKLRQDFIFSVGLVDPHRDQVELDRINVDAPLRLLERLCKIASQQQWRLITFGTVLAGYPDLAVTNPYLRSKARLLAAWQEHSRSLPFAWIHTQMHTLYGGAKPPHEFMFTGQMLSALRSRSVFRMSSGTQVREYHHLDDIAKSVVSFLAAQGEEPFLLELSSGAPMRVRDLAYAVFDHFGARELLSIGARPNRQPEVFDSRHRRTTHLIAYREPCAGVIAWFEALGVRRKP
jgi:nucleoside-diphosphate-sugar epimerase